MDSNNELIGRCIGSRFDWREYEQEFSDTPVWPLIMQLYWLTQTLQKWRENQWRSDKKQTDQ